MSGANINAVLDVAGRIITALSSVYLELLVGVSLILIDTYLGKEFELKVL